MNSTYLIERSEPIQAYGISREAITINRAKQVIIDNFIHTSIYNQKQIKDALRMRFVALRSKWLDETKYFSDSDLIYSNRNYRKIIELGSDVISLLIEDLEAEEVDWFCALVSLTGIDPTPIEHRGNIPAMRNDWINWAANKF